MSSKNATPPTRSTDPQAPDYAVSDAQEAWEKMNQLVDKVLDASKKPLEPKPDNSNTIGHVGKVTDD